MGIRSVRSVVVLAALLAAGLLASAAQADTPHAPTAIAVDGNGTSYVGDGDSGQIKVYDSTGAFVAAWGTPGQAAGQLGGVIAMDLDAAGNVYVLDTYNRVQEFTAAGAYVTGTALPACTRGSAPSAPGLGGLDVTPQFTFVASPCSDVVYRRNPDLSANSQFAVLSPRGVYATADKLYVARWNGLDVAIFDLAGNALGTQPVGGQPGDVYVDTYNVLHVSDVSHDVIHMFGSDGVEFRTLGRPGANPGDLNDPWSFDVAAQGTSFAGDIFVADYGNKRVQRWNSYGYTYFARADDGGGATTPPPPPPPPPPPSARVGVTVNDASAFTGSKTVTLTITPLPGATGVVLSNDGGFGGATERGLSGDNRYTWTLASSGAERLPKTVYVRFSGGGVDDTKTFTDDIVLDETAPTVSSATFAPAAATARATTAAAKQVAIRVTAKDALSGVSSLQLAATPKSKRIANVPYKKTIRVAAADGKYVRAIDKAGNPGRWVKVRAPKKKH